MKKIIPIFIVLLISCHLTAQEKSRVSINGSIQMPGDNESQGISVFNINTNRGTVTNEAGQFIISVGVNDSVMISAVQFQEFTVVINEGVMESSQLNINVAEVVNELPEVIVSPYDLTGNVNVDIARLSVIETPDTLNSMDAQSRYFEADAEPDFQSPPRNTAIDMHYKGMENGLNFANLFKQLLITSRREQVRRPEDTVATDVRELYSDEFFRENLDLELEDINEFIYFADDNGLDERMLKEGNELDLIQFLVEQSKRFKRQRVRN